MTCGPTSRAASAVALLWLALLWLGLTGCSGGSPESRSDGGREASVVDAPLDARRHDAAKPDAGHNDAAQSDARITDARHPDDSRVMQRDGALEAAADAATDAGIAALRIVGRSLTDGTSPDGNGTCTAPTPCFEWSGTEVVARFTGSSEISFLLSDYGNYFDVYVDGTLQTTPPIIGSESTTAYLAATGLDGSLTHEVRLYKRTEASSFGRTIVKGVAFPDGGTLLPPLPAAGRRIEVVGDSISCGYGVLGSSGTCTGAASNEDDDVSFGAITARNLGADLFTIASSGTGMYEDYTGNRSNTLPAIYGDTLPYVTGTPATWDFANFTPDAVVINLGTNDFIGSGGDPGQPFVLAYESFLERVRHNYPDAYIVCTNGPMLTGAEYTLAATYIQQAMAAVNDSKTLFLAFPTQSSSPADQGCQGHPDVATHQAMAAQLTALLEPLLP